MFVATFVLFFRLSSAGGRKCPGNASCTDSSCTNTHVFPIPEVWQLDALLAEQKQKGFRFLYPSVHPDKYPHLLKDFKEAWKSEDRFSDWVAVGLIFAYRLATVPEDVTSKYDNFRNDFVIINFCQCCTDGGKHVMVVGRNPTNSDEMVMACCRSVDSMLTPISISTEDPLLTPKATPPTNAPRKIWSRHSSHETLSTLPKAKALCFTSQNALLKRKWTVEAETF